jgi:hypothetical protein
MKALSRRESFGRHQPAFAPKVRKGTDCVCSRAAKVLLGGFDTGIPSILAEQFGIDIGDERETASF